MTFGGRNLRGQNIALAWQNQSQQRIAVTVTTSCSTPLFYERWTRPTDFRLRSPPSNVISQVSLTLLHIMTHDVFLTFSLSNLQGVRKAVRY
jgi:hypothetical protein